MRKASFAFFGGCGLLLLAVAGLAFGERGVSFVFALAAAATGYILTAKNAPALPAAMVIAGFIAVRLLPLAQAPALSDDWYRYAHEARASRSDLGVVYRIAPKDLLPAPVPDDGLSAKVNHPEIKAAYPPLSQLTMLGVFALGDAASLPLVGLKLFFLLLDIGAALLLWRRKGRAAFALYAFCPLVLVDVLWNVHVDTCALFLLVAAVSARGALARGALIGAAAGFKPIAPLALALLARPQWLRGGSAFAGAFVMPYVLYMALGAPVFSGFVEYATRWEAHATVYKLAEAPFTAPFAARAEAGRWARLHVSGEGLLIEENGVTQWRIGTEQRVQRPVLLDARFFARLVIAAAFALLAIFIVRRKRRDHRPGLLLAGAYLFAPTLHPWYLLWALPFAAATRDARLAAACGAGLLLYADRYGLEGNPAWLILIAYAGALWRAPAAERAASGASEPERRDERLPDGTD